MYLMTVASRFSRFSERRVAGKATCFVHMRNGGPVEPGVIDSLQEVLADAAVTGVGAAHRPHHQHGTGANGARSEYDRRSETARN